jgi:hypothetical protein
METGLTPTCGHGLRSTVYGLRSMPSASTVACVLNAGHSLLSQAHAVSAAWAFCCLRDARAACRALRLSLPRLFRQVAQAALPVIVLCPPAPRNDQRMPLGTLDSPSLRGAERRGNPPPLFRSATAWINADGLPRCARNDGGFEGWDVSMSGRFAVAGRQSKVAGAGCSRYFAAMGKGQRPAPPSRHAFASRSQ